MPKLTLPVLGFLVLGSLLAVVPALAGDAPAPAPLLCGADSSAAAAGGLTEPQPALFLIFRCGVCSEPLCQNKNVGSTCGAGPAFEGFRCTNPSSCPSDGLYTCACELV